MVHYELPNSSEIFVHRSGRTGRAGKKGSAILIHSSGQHRDVKGIERDVGCRFIEVRRLKSVMLLLFDVIYSYFSHIIFYGTDECEPQLEKRALRSRRRLCEL